MVLWIALAVLLLGVVAGIAYAAARGWQLFRTAKRTGAAITSEMDRISAVTVEIEQHLAKADAASRRLTAATTRLTISRAQLDVQLAAVRRARAQMRRVFWFVPGV